MKRIIISAAIAMSAAAAYAEPVTVMTPKAGASIAEQQAYVAELDSAVENVCKKDTAPIYGVAFYSYKACLKETRLQVAKKDPTGLYGASESKGALVLASK